MNSVQPLQRKPKLWRYVLLLVLLVFAAAIWSVLNPVKIRDWFILATYSPPGSVVQLAATDTMTPYAKQLFYVNRPQLLGKSAFASECPSGSAQTYVIGCYHSGDTGIYILNVAANQLDGIIPVTAAYEMLHAGYARLNGSTRASIDSVMWGYYTTHNLGSEIAQQMAAYSKTEPGQQSDELYSVLATEVASLPVYLENNYKLYFSDRGKIVALYRGYETAFSSRILALNDASAELDSTRVQIDDNENAIAAQLAAVNSMQQTLDREQSGGEYAEYNAGVTQYNSLVDSYNQLVATTRSEIASYNQTVAARNRLAIEEQQLVSAISSEPTAKSLK